MSKSLIIVESPTKIKTLQKLLGAKYVFESSYGHIRDLPEKEFGIEIEKDFEPDYVTLPSKKEVIAKLKKAAKECDTVYLSPDPDREGEAIAWHIAAILPPKTNIKRVSFNAITKDAVEEALKNPRSIDMPLVNAQQARRLLDRLVGYTISPLLNKRLRRGRSKGVSAGRVQSVALKLVVDRERQIEAFIPREYWTIYANLKKNIEDKPFISTLFSIDGVRIEKEPIEGKVEGKDFTLIPDETTSKKIVEELKVLPYAITRVDRKEKKRNPEAPFITSTLQQEASRHFRFSPAKTMEIAQSLYEGIDLGQEGAEGLITYMRTDSVRVENEAIAQARQYIGQSFSEDYLPSAPRMFSVKKSAQDAHEAIRPTNVFHHPDAIAQYLSREQFNLYSLIWKRFVASQMNPAIYDTVSVDIQAGPRYLLRATGSLLKFPGFLALYEEKKDEDDESEEHKLLPDLQEGLPLILDSIKDEQSFTRPPPRYTEATLVKELEKSGIGRPSTYATIMKKIQSRDYTVKEQGRLKPTDLGRLVIEIMETNFKEIVNIGFTASLEDSLEEVAEDKKNWKVLLKDFWGSFAPTLKEAEEKPLIPKTMTDIPCPKCGAKLQKIWSKSHYFLGCEKYPDCDYTISMQELTFDKSKYAEDFNFEQNCPMCSGPMKLRFGKFGPFLGCQNYPNCKGIVNIPKKGESIDQEQVGCFAIGCTGHLVKRRSRFGKMFYSCTEYPACDVIGNELDEMREKYKDHPKTASVKKPKAGAKKKEETEKKAKTTKKAATKKKPAAKAKPKKAATSKTTKKVVKKAAPKAKKTTDVESK